MNKVYNELISFKSHVHMNGKSFRTSSYKDGDSLSATRWTTLSDFIRHLSTRSDCVVEETSKGWFITCTSSDPDGIHRHQRQSKRARETAADARLEKVRKIKHISSGCLLATGDYFTSSGF